MDPYCFSQPTLLRLILNQRLVLKFGEGPWFCDESLRWIIEVLIAEEDSFSIFPLCPVVCAGPPCAEGENVIRLNLSRYDEVTQCHDNPTVSGSDNRQGNLYVLCVLGYIMYTMEFFVQNTID